MYNNLYTTNNYVTLKIIVKAKISIYISNPSLLIQSIKIIIQRIAFKMFSVGSDKNLKLQLQS